MSFIRRLMEIKEEQLRLEKVKKLRDVYFQSGILTRLTDILDILKELKGRKKDGKRNKVC